MAEENNAGQAGAQGEPNAQERKFTQAEVDEIVKARVARAKAQKPDDYDDLKAAAAELEEIKQRGMSEAEKAADRAEKSERRAEEAEAKLAAFEAEAKRAKDAAEVSERTGVPASLITAADREAMEKQAEAIKAYAQGQPSAPVFKGDGEPAQGSSKGSKQAHFADFINQISR